MIVEAADFADGATLAADICIVGAGAVGITLALELGRSGLDVLLLEAGGTRAEAEVQDFYRGTVTRPALHNPIHEYRERRLGGSTTIWGGRCMPFDPIDFEWRDWIADSGWPIPYSALNTYYARANRICEAGAFAYRLDDAFDRAAQPMIDGFAGEAFSSDTLERFSCPTDFGRRYRDRLAALHNVRLMTGCAVTDIGLLASGAAVDRLTLRTRAGATLSVKARHVVLAAGGLETTRLMLASDGVMANGIGNDHDVLGRYYMCHLAGTIGDFRPRAGSAGVWHGYDIADDGTYCRRRLAIRPSAQRIHQIGNFVARLHHPHIPDARHGSGVLSALYLGRVLIPRAYRKRVEASDPFGLRGTARHVANVGLHAPEVARFARQMLLQRRLAERKFPSVVVRPRNHSFSLDFHAEQEPNRDSQVRLGAERDAYGMRRLEVDWRYTDRDVATVRTALDLLAADLRRSGAGTLGFDPDQVEAEMIRYGAYAGHHIGTARMGTDVRRSVVDPDCRVHGISNLHLAGAAVFPTSSQANPTLTAVALALRLGERLAATMRDVAAPAAIAEPERIVAMAAS